MSEHAGEILILVAGALWGACILVVAGMVLVAAFAQPVRGIRRLASSARTARSADQPDQPADQPDTQLSRFDWDADFERMLRQMRKYGG